MHKSSLNPFGYTYSQGPDRETMEAGYLKLYGYGIMVDENGKEIPLYSLFHFHHDIGYYQTAHLLVESAMLLLEKHNAGTLTKPGVVTPAVAFGNELTKRVTKEIECTFDLQEEPFDTSTN